MNGFIRVRMYGVTDELPRDLAALYRNELQKLTQRNEIAKRFVEKIVITVDDHQIQDIAMFPEKFSEMPTRPASRSRRIKERT